MEEIIKIPKIDKIKIEDYGIIKRADIGFNDGLNIITGPNASGKTTAIQFLKEKYDINKLPHGEKMMLHIDSVLGSNETILMDDLLNTLDERSALKTLDILSTSGKQVILTMNENMDISQIKANVINTKDFELKDKKCHTNFPHRH